MSWPPGAPRTARRVRAVLSERFGSATWLHLHVLPRIVEGLRDGEQLVDLARTTGARDRYVVLTSERVGLVPASVRRPPRWHGFDEVRAIAVDGEDLLVTGVGEPDRWRGLEPAGQAEAIAAGIAAEVGIGVTDLAEPDLAEPDLAQPDLVRPDMADPDDDRRDDGGAGALDGCGCGCGCEDDWEDEAGGSWPQPADDAVHRRLSAFADELRHELAGVAVVDPEHPGQVSVRSRLPGAISLTWIDSGWALRLDLHRLGAQRGAGGSVEFERTPAGAARLEQAVRSLATGRASARVVRRRRTLIDLGDGTTLRAEQLAGDRRPG